MMGGSERDILLDVTRLVSRSWTRRRSTGIDRVCYAYLRHFRPRALAVVQFRGRVKVLGERRSEQLFDLLLGTDTAFRDTFARFAAMALFEAEPGLDGSQTYLNVSHTDFDLPAHWQWIRRHGVKSAYFIHDLIPIRHPEFSRPHAVKRHLGRVQQALAQADMLITSSQAVAQDLQAFAREKGLATPPICTASIAGESFAQRPVPAPQGAYFLALGTIEPRKNYALLLAVWQRLSDRLGEAAPRLIIAGQSGPMTGEILAPLRSDPALTRLIEWRPNASDAEVAGLLQGTQALLFPSLAEGFGLPIVEALAVRTPVIASDLAIVREVGQGLPQLVAPDDPSAWERAIASQVAKRPDLPPFAAPQWSEHFVQINAAIQAPNLPASPLCERSRAA